MAIFITNARAIVLCDNLAVAMDAGGPAEINIYSGSVPADADAALSGNTLLANLVMSTTAFLGAGDDTPGAITLADVIADETSALATDDAAFFRIANAADTIRFMQGSVAAGGGDLNLNTISIVTGATVSVTAFSITVPES